MEGRIGRIEKMLHGAISQASIGKSVVVVAQSAVQAEQLRQLLVDKGATGVRMARMDFQFDAGTIYIRAVRHIMRGWLEGIPIDVTLFDDQASDQDRARIMEALRPNMSKDDNRDRRCSCQSDDFGAGFDLCDSCASLARARVP